MPSQCLVNHQERSISAIAVQKSRRTDHSDSPGLKSDGLLGNEFIALIKNSALVSLLTIADLMHEGQKIISVSYRSLEVYLAIALVYLILTSAAGLILRRAEQRLRMGGMVQ